MINNRYLKNLLYVLSEDLDEAALRGFSLDILKKNLRQGSKPKLNIDNITKAIIDELESPLGGLGKQIGKEFGEWLASKPDINISNISRLYDGKEIVAWLETLPAINAFIANASRDWKARQQGWSKRQIDTMATYAIVAALKSESTIGEDPVKVGKYIRDMLEQYRLPFLGEGSSRAVYALSTSKVLKVAINKKGIAQNVAEDLVWINPATQYIGAQIYEIDPEGRWAVMEIAKVYSRSAEKELKSDLGWPDTLAWHRGYDIAQAAEHIHEVKNREFEVNKVLQDWYGHQRYFNPSNKELIDDHRKFLEKPPRGMKALVTLMYRNIKKLRLKPGDIVTEHFGKTADGRAVLIDYGFTSGVAENYYFFF